MGLWCINCNNVNAKEFDIENKICKQCGTNKLVYTSGDMTFGEMFVLEDISKDISFIQAMIDLRKNDPIEYQLKMSQFKANLSQQESAPKKTTNKVTCPYCQSTNTKKIDRTERITSVAVLGIFSKKINKSFKCRDCGGTF